MVNETVEGTALETLFDSEAPELNDSEPESAVQDSLPGGGIPEAEDISVNGASDDGAVLSVDGASASEEEDPDELHAGA
jgi:hypothetical protein